MMWVPNWGLGMVDADRSTGLGMVPPPKLVYHLMFVTSLKFKVTGVRSFFSSWFVVRPPSLNIYFLVRAKPPSSSLLPPRSKNRKR